MTKVAGNPAVIYHTLGVHPNTLAGQVVKGGQGVGPSPDRSGLHSPGNLVDQPLPGYIFFLLGQEGQQGSLEGDLAGLRLGLLLEELGHLLLGHLLDAGQLHPHGAPNVSVFYLVRIKQS